MIKANGAAALSVSQTYFERSLGVFCFLVTMLSMATVGMVVPLSAEFTRMLGMSSGQFGVALSLFSIPSALLSFMVGYLCDQIGGRRLFFGGAIIAMAADLLLLQVQSAIAFKATLFLAGVGFAAIVVSSPALITASLAGVRRTRALSLWSTYAPVGVAVGLLIAAPFAGQAYWQLSITVHCAMLLLATIVAGFAFRQRIASPFVRSTADFRAMASLLHHGGLIRLAIALAIPSAISYGTSLLAPSYITAVTHVSIASAAVLVAVAKIMVALCGGIFAGWLLARKVSAWHMFAALAMLGSLGQLALFYPGSGLVISLAGLAAWLFAYAGISALCFVLLPTLFTRTGEMGAANGLVSQLVSCASFTAPIIYFGDFPWTAFPALCAIGIGIALLILPRPVRRKGAAAESAGA